MTSSIILYVEDEEADVMLLQFALKKAQIPNPLKRVRNGEEAVAYLSGTGQYGCREAYPLPGLVLLDLNLPRLSGMKVLQWIRERPEFASLPVVVYSSSGQLCDRENAQQLGANDYIVKSSMLDEIAVMLRGLKGRWLSPPAE